MRLPAWVLAGALALQAAQTAIPPGVRERVEAGLRAKQAGDLESAIRLFEEVADLVPDLAAAHVNLGAARLEARRYGAAASALRKAVELAPQLTGAQAMLGTALLIEGYAEEAIPHLEQGKRTELVGVALLESGRLVEAIPALEQALSERPDDPDLLYYLGRAHGRLAEQLLDRLLEAHPGSPRAHQLRGEVQQAAGDREAAERELRLALEARADLPGARLALGDLYRGGGDYATAEQHYRAEAEARPGDAAAAFKLGSILLQLGRIEEARDWLEKANRRRPDMPETMAELARALVLAGRPADAESLLRRVLELEDSSLLAESSALQLSQILRQQGRAEEADRALARFREIRQQRLDSKGP